MVLVRLLFIKSRSISWLGYVERQYERMVKRIARKERKRTPPGRAREKT